MRTPKERRDAHTAQLVAILRARGYSPEGWLTRQLDGIERVPFDDVRARLARLLPLRDRDPEAAGEVLVQALAALGDRVHLAQPGGEATWVVVGPQPPKRPGPVWGPKIDRSTQEREVASQKKVTEGQQHARKVKLLQVNARLDAMEKKWGAFK